MAQSRPQISNSSKVKVFENNYDESAMIFEWSTLEQYFKAVGHKIAGQLNNLIKVQKALKDFGINGGYYIKGKYIIFRGNQKKRIYIKGIKYLKNNAMLLRLNIGVRSLKSSVKSGLKGVLGISFVVLVLSNIEHLLTGDVVKFITFGAVDFSFSVIGAVMGTVAASLVTKTTFITSAVITAATPIAIAIGVVVLATWLDKKYQLKQKLYELVVNELEMFETNLRSVSREIRWIMTTDDGAFYFMSRLIGN
ncbi:MAG: hypothetical protein AB2733_13055 [Candidatus Thiodiazotropha taylori]